MEEVITHVFRVLLSSVFLLVTIANGIHCAHDSNTEVLNRQNFVWIQEQQSFASSSCFSQKSRQKNGATILEVVLPEHCSKRALDWNRKQQKRLALDDARVKALQSRIRSAMSCKIEDALTTQIPLTSGIRLQTLNYIVTITLGGKNLSVIVDTGSDLTWVQCQPCRLCYNQRDPLFNPSTSPTYRSIPCNSSTCQSLGYAKGNLEVCGTGTRTCDYYMSYGDGSYTRGELGFEQLNLGTTSVNKFVFGCGRNNKGLFGGASGLMGLGRSALSLISQTSTVFGGVFSYCLPTTEAAASGSLVFGHEISVYKNRTPITYTSMIQNLQLPTFYFLNLTGISIAGVVLRSPSFGKGGILIDSGTVITRLQPSIYRAFKDEFLKQFFRYPPAPGFSILDTCFNLSAYNEVNVPMVKMHFDGDAELDVDVNGIFYFAKPDASQVCLALASLTHEGEMGIIGNYQQKNQRIIYDTEGSKLGFSKETCSYVQENRR